MALIRFPFGARHPLFADPTPRDSDEYKVFTAYTDSDTRLNTGRVYSGASDESVRNAIDLYSLAMHEIGHVLGIDAMYSQYVAQERPGDLANTFKINVTRSRPHVGYEIPIVFGPHICDGFNPCRFVDPDGYRMTPNVLMTLDPIPGERVLISGVDALLIAQLNLVANPDATLFWPMWPTASVMSVADRTTEVEPPNKLELVINVKIADALRINFPQSLLLRADDLSHSATQRRSAGGHAGCVPIRCSENHSWPPSVPTRVLSAFA